MKKILYSIGLFMLLLNSVKAQPHSVNIEYKEKNDTLSFMFFNTTNDTLQLFSTYFTSPYLSSKVLHKIDAKNHVCKVSFLPLLPYLAGYLTDRLVLTDEKKIVMAGQNLYSFIEISPKNIIKVKLPYHALFAKKGEKNNVVKDFNNETINTKNIKELTLSKQKGAYKLIFEFAVYKEINLLRTRDLYINSGLETYKQTTNYEIISISVALNNYKLPIEIKK